MELFCDYKYHLKREPFMLSFWAGQLESELSVQNQMLSTRDAELMAAKEEVKIAFRSVYTSISVA